MARCNHEGIGLLSNEFNPEYIFNLFKNTQNPVLQRFYGFKSSGGVDEDDNEYSPHNLFNPDFIYHTGYSSNQSYNLLVTGEMVEYKHDFMAQMKEFFDRKMINLILVIIHDPTFMKKMLKDETNEN